MIRLYRTLARWIIGPTAPEAEREMVEVFTDAYDDASPLRRIGLGVTALADLVLTRCTMPGRRPSAFAAGVGTDVKLVFRELCSGSRFGIFVVATLALGIGANAAIFSVVHAVLLRPLPLANAERVLVPVAYRGDDPFQVSAFDYLEWERTSESFDAFGLSTSASMVLDVEGEPRPVSAARVTPGYFETLGAAPVLGRSFVDEDACCRENPVALLGYGLWRRGFGGRADVLGETIVLDGVGHTVVGVMPADIDVPFATELWVPLALDALEEDERRARDYFAVLALADGVSREEGRAELQAIAARLQASYPDTHAGWTAEAITLREHVLSDFDGRVAPSLVALLVSVGFLLLIACANVSNLFLTRAMDRGHELSVRTALGATRARLVRHLAIETVVLATLGGGAALLLLRWLLPVLARVSPIEPVALAGRLQALELDGAVIGFSVAVTLIAALGLGLVSALQISQARLRDALRSARPALGRRRVMHALVVAQMAVAVCLAIGAGLTASSLERLRSLELGFEPEGLLAARTLFVAGDDASHAERAIAVDDLLERVRAVPGVTSAGATTNLPADHLSWDAVYTPRGGTPFDPKNIPLVADRVVSAGYLETLGVELVSGRLLQTSDRPDAEPVVVITRDLGERAWPGQDPLGKQIKRGAPDADSPWMTVVGVVEPVKEDRAAFRRDRPAWYVPYPQLDTDRHVTIVARALSTGTDVETLRASLLEAVRDEGRTLAAYELVDVEDHMDALLSGERFGVGFVSSFSVLGLALASLGIYGALSSAVASRRREIGLRMALGADALRLVRRFTGEGVVLAAKGIALGLLGALVAGRLLSAILYRVHPADPVVFALAAAVAVVVALAAAYGPARRASGVDAAKVIRGE